MNISAESLRLVGLDGLEPSTSRLSGARSSHLSYKPLFFSVDILVRPSVFPFEEDGGDDGVRTHDPLLAGQVLSQLSYTPVFRVVCSLFQRSYRSLKIEQQKFRTPLLCQTSSSIVLNYVIPFSPYHTFSIERR